MNCWRNRQLLGLFQASSELPVGRRAPGWNCPRWMQCFLIPIVFLVVLAIVVPAPCAGESQRLFRIGTGGTAGVYYPIGKLIAQGFNEASGKAGAPQTGTPGTPALVAVAQSSGGSVANVQALASGEIEAGLVQADVAAWAFHGDRVFSGDDSVKVVRAVAGLYSEKLQIVTRRDANIRSVADLRGKRISIDEVGSGTLMAMRIVLDAHGLSENDLIPMYLKPEFTDDKIVTGELQGFVVMAGTPMKAADRLAGMELFFVPIEPEIALRINAEYPYLVPGKISAGIYPGVPDTPTLQVHALLVVSSTTPEDVVYELTAALWSETTLALLKDGHPEGRTITPKTALDGISIPLHPGAARFYREQGMFPEEVSSR